MADFNLGAYRPRPMGDFNTSQSYRYLDIVKYDGGSYININLDTIDGEACIGIAPKGQAQSSLYWQCLAEKGEKGDIADSYSPYIRINDGNWDYRNGDKAVIPDNGSTAINITNVYDGCCGIIVTKNELQLPSNSLYSLDFNYVTKTEQEYYLYTFTYVNIGSNSYMFMWNRSVMNHG